MAAVTIVDTCPFVYALFILLARDFVFFLKTNIFIVNYTWSLVQHVCIYVFCLFFVCFLFLFCFIFVLLFSFYVFFFEGQVLHVWLTCAHHH